MAQVQREFGSHTNAEALGFNFAVTYGELMTGIHATAFVNSNRDVKKNPKPLTILWPWPDKPKAESKAPDITPAERERLRQRLRRHSGIRQDGSPHG